MQPTVYLVDGFIPSSSVAMISAFGSSLKTWAMIDLVLAVATGGRWLDRFPCAKGKALIVDWESGDHELRRRLIRCAIGRGLEGPVEGVAFSSFPDVYFNADEFPRAVHDLAHGRTLIAFDSLSAGSPGADENSARFADGLKALRKVAVETGCSFLVLHHTRKSTGFTGARTDKRELVRGSGAIFAACDVMIDLAPAKGTDSMVATPTKARGGGHVDPFLLSVEGVHDRGKPELLREPIHVKAHDVVGATPPRQDLKGRILAVLSADKGMSSNDVRAAARCKKEHALAALHELEGAGKVVHAAGQYRLAPTEGKP